MITRERAFRDALKVEVLVILNPPLIVLLKSNQMNSMDSQIALVKDIHAIGDTWRLWSAMYSVIPLDFSHCKAIAAG